MEKRKSDTLNLDIAKLLEDLVFIPDLNCYVSKFKVKNVGRLSWYTITKSLESLGYGLPLSREWNKVERFMNKNSIENDFLKGPLEFTDTLLILPDERGNYSPKIYNFTHGYYNKILLVEHPKIVKFSDDLLFEKGEVEEVKNLPLKSGYVQEWDEDLGLPKKVGDRPNKEFFGAYFRINSDPNYGDGLRVIVRGNWTEYKQSRRFDVRADITVDKPHPMISFRVTKKV
jgi:hypothetical protein